MVRLASRLKASAHPAPPRHDPQADFKQHAETAASLYLKRRETMLHVHKRLNHVSGQMVTAYGNVSDEQMRGWSEQMRIWADQLDGLRGT